MRIPTFDRIGKEFPKNFDACPIGMASLSFCPHGIVEEILIGQADAVFQLGLVDPAQPGGLAYIQEFAGRAVGTGGVPLDDARISYHFGHQFGEGLDGEFLAGAGVDGLVAAVVVHQEHAEVGKVIDIKELS